MPNIPPPPPGFSLDSQPAPSMAGRPVIMQGAPLPSPQTPAQVEGQDLTNQEKRYETQAKPVYDRANSIDKVRDGYRADKRVLKYEDSIPIYTSALNAPDTPEADTLLVNAIAKIGDPSTGVQQREGDSYEQASPQAEQIRAKLMKQFGADENGNFTPEARRRIKEAMRARMGAIADQYRLARKEHIDYIKSLGLPNVDPEAVVGPFAGLPFQDREAKYLGHKPMLNYIEGPNGQPLDPQTRQPREFGPQQDTGVVEIPPEQVAAFQQAIHAIPPGQLTAEKLNEIAMQYTGRPLMGDTGSVADYYNQTGVTASDVTYGRPPEVTAGIEQKLATGGTAGSAGVAGFADTASFGLLDEAGAGVEALGQSLSGNGSIGENFDRNLQINRGYLEKLQDQHPVGFGVGQLAGAVAMPFGSGARTPAALAKVGAVQGAAYGAGSGEGLQGRGLNALMGGATGAAVGYGAGRASNALARSPKAVPELVDQTTGKLNEPLEAMRPGQRVAAAKEFGIDLPMGAATDRGGAIIEKGLDNLPGSAGVMNDGRRVVEGQVTDAADNVAGKFGSSRTLDEAGSELQRGAQEWIGRAGEVDRKVYNAIPISDAAPASVGNAKAILGELTSRFQSNPELAATMQNPTLKKYAAALEKGGLSWQDLKDFRSIIGNQIGEMRFGEAPSKSDLRALYGALSEDMRQTAAAMGPQASRAFDRANTFHAQMEKRIEQSLVRILGKDSNNNPAKAAAALQAMTKGGKATGDLKTLAQIKASTVKSGAWDEVASTLIRLGGQPAGSQGRAFNPQTFVQWYADMSEPARKMLFGGTDLRKSLDQFVAVNQRLAGTAALRNTSNTGSAMFGGGTMLTAGAAMFNPLLGAKLAGVMATNFGMAKAWTNPAFVRWATGYAKAVAAGNANAARSQVGRLSKIATADPTLREGLVSLQRHLLNAANDNGTIRAAASDADPQKQQ